MLYIVGTPIGNLDDISYRQANILLSSDIILAEDTRSAMILIERAKNIVEINKNSIKYQKTKIVSYYKDIEMQKLPLVLKWLKEGKNISLISEAGMPLISDPGYLLIKACIHKDIPFTVIPGPSAVTTALIYSGFQTDQFMFLGFLPKKSQELKKVLEKIQSVQQQFKNTVFVVFESPLRIKETIILFNEFLPQNEIIIARELTKRFEEILRGKPKDFLNKQFRGELTIIIGSPL